MIYSIHDKRSVDDKEANLEALDRIERKLESGIADYSIESSEDLFDGESDEIVRKLDFSQGTRTYSFVICSNGFIRMMQEKCPIQLLLDIHNYLISKDLNRDDQ